MNSVNNVVGYVGTHIAALPSLRMPTFMTNALAKMTEQQKKIALVVSIVISALAALFIAYKCCGPRPRVYGGNGGGGFNNYNPPNPMPIGGFGGNQNNNNNANLAPAPIGGFGGNQNNNNNAQPAPVVPLPNPFLNNFNNNNFNNYNNYNNYGYNAHVPNLNNIPVPADETLNLQEVENQIQNLKFEIEEGKQDLEVLENEKQILEIKLAEIRSVKEEKVPNPVEENKEEDKAAEVVEKEAVVEEKVDEADKQEEKEDVLLDPQPAVPAPIDADPAKDEKAIEVAPAPIVEKEDESEAIILEVQIVDQQMQIEEKEKYIKQLEDKLEKALQDYGQTLRLYLEKQFNNQNYNNNKDNNEIHEHIVKLIEIMDRYKDKNSFVVENLTQINLFLANTFFTKGHCLDEGKKVDLAVFNHFYTIVNAHFPTLQKADPALAQQLKIKLANLPLIDKIDRSKFTYAHLNETDQLNLLIAHFDKKETDTIQTVIQQFKNYKIKNLTEQEVKKLAKLASENRSHLIAANKYMLQDELKDFLKHQAPANWNDDQKVYEALKKFFNPVANPYVYQQYNNYNYDYHQNAPTSGVLTLYRTSKARKFFDEQILNIANVKTKIINTTLPLIDANERTKISPVDSQDEQLNLLLNYFENEEENCLQPILANFKTKQLTDQDIEKLVDLLHVQNHDLATQHKFALQDALETFIKEKRLEEKRPANYQNNFDWENHQTVCNELKKHLKSIQGQVSAEIAALQKAAKSRKSFYDQIQLVQIPRWYHATKPDAIQNIIQQGKIEVRHQQAYKGVWVSTQREITFGNYTLVFNHRIAKLGPVFIGYEYKDKLRWRGLQAEVPIIETLGEPPIPYVTYAGVPKAAQNVNKAAIIALLKQKGIDQPVVFHNEQIDFMRQEVIDVLGSPNLSEHWWGKGDMAKAIAVAR